MAEEKESSDHFRQSFHGLPAAVGLGVKSLLAGAIGGERRLDTENVCIDKEVAPAPLPDGETDRDVDLNTEVMARSETISTDQAATPLVEGRSNAFAKLVKGWEAYINDSEEGLDDTFSSLQKIHNLELCTPQYEGLYSFQRLTGPLMPTPEDAPLPPQALRHTHSTPLKYGPSIFEEESTAVVPGPIPLDPYQRSSSTPSSFRHRSVTSAFSTLTPGSTLNHRASYTSLKAFGSTSRSQSAFDPVRYYAYALDEMERTSIEVVNTLPDPEVDKIKTNRGAASRAAKFLADVGVLRRRRRNTHKMGQIHEVATVQSEVTSAPSSFMERQDSNMTAITEQVVDVNVPDTSVTVFTEHEPGFNDFSVLSGGSDVSAIMNSLHTTTMDDASPPTDTPNYGCDDKDEDDGSPIVQHYQKLYGEEEELKICRIEPSLRQDSVSTGTPSPPYQQMLDDPGMSQHQADVNFKGGKIELHLSKSLVLIGSPSTPSPTAGGNSTTGSTDSGTASPGTYGTSSTTQGTYTSMKSNPQSGLTTISETDREVMMANRAGYVQISNAQKELDAILRSAAPRNRYVALNDSPPLLRDGANVPAEEMFTRQESNLTGRRSVSFQLPHGVRNGGQSNSPGTLETSSATNTTSSTAATEEKPPTFVTYLERQGASDLTSVREVSNRMGRESLTEGNRDDSPAKLTAISYPDVIFEKASSMDSSSSQPMSRSGRSCHLSRPPRSPFKSGHRQLNTPPPRISVSPLLHHESPPRNIIDHPTSSPVSRPHVMRTTSPIAISPLSFQEGSVQGQRYADGSVEILKADSKEDRLTPAHLVSEKENQ